MKASVKTVEIVLSDSRNLDDMNWYPIGLEWGSTPAACSSCAEQTLTVDPANEAICLPCYVGSNWWRAQVRRDLLEIVKSMSDSDCSPDAPMQSGKPQQEDQ